MKSNRLISNLVDVVLLTEPIVCIAHGVEDTHHLHGGQPGADWREAHDVAEQDADGVKLLTSVERRLSAAEFVSDGLGDHLVEEFVRLLDARLQLCTPDSLLDGRKNTYYNIIVYHIHLSPSVLLYTVEPPIKDTPNKGHLSIKDKSTCPNSYYISTF